MKTLLFVLVLALATGCDNSALEAELAAVKSELAETQAQLVAEREARERAERERAEILRAWAAEKNAEAKPRFDRFEYLGVLDQGIRDIQRCLVSGPLRELSGPLLHAALTDLQNYRKAIATGAMPNNQLVNSLPPPKALHLHADSFEQGVVPKLRDRAWSRHRIESLIRSLREIAHYIERIK